MPVMTPHFTTQHPTTNMQALTVVNFSVTSILEECKTLWGELDDALQN